MILKTGGWVIDSLREAILRQKLDPSLPVDNKKLGAGHKKTQVRSTSTVQCDTENLRQSC